MPQLFPLVLVREISSFFKRQIDKKVILFFFRLFVEIGEDFVEALETDWILHLQAVLLQVALYDVSYV